MLMGLSFKQKVIAFFSKEHHEFHSFNSFNDTSQLSENSLLESFQTNQRSTAKLLKFFDCEKLLLID